MNTKQAQDRLTELIEYWKTGIKRTESIGCCGLDKKEAELDIEAFQMAIRSLEALDDGNTKIIFGKWERRKNVLGEEITVCSVCGEIRRQANGNYCANCGAQFVW